MVWWKESCENTKLMLTYLSCVGVKLLNYHKQMHYHEYICWGKWAPFFNFYGKQDFVKGEI